MVGYIYPMPRALSALIIQRVRHILRTRGYAETLSWEEAAALFGEYVGYYLSGHMTHAFLCALADELLLRLCQRRDEAPNAQFFDVLLATSMAPSISSRQERTHYLKTLGSLVGLHIDS